MDKREACHRLAEINEEIYDLENSLASIESKLSWDDERKREWYLARKEEVMAKLEKAKEEHDAFYNEYYDIIHS